MAALIILSSWSLSLCIALTIALITFINKK